MTVELIKHVPLAKLRKKFGEVTDQDIEILAVAACDTHDEKTFEQCSIALSDCHVSTRMWHRARVVRLISADCVDQDRTVREWAQTSGR